MNEKEPEPPTFYCPVFMPLQREYLAKLVVLEGSHGQLGQSNSFLCVSGCLYGLGLIVDIACECTPRGSLANLRV